ncbi:MAG: CoA transferase [Pseudomonadales bacterium]|nr:CoA transferase [Pseudomonadales bacterium]
MHTVEPLAGIRVVEMTLAVQGPVAGVFLRDMGAEVIKVEPPLGDPARYGRGVANETPPGTLGPQFVAANRGKRSVCVDLTTADGQRALHALLVDADVFLTNYRRLALDRLGLDYPHLRERYPRLVYASVNGFGPAGPDADKAMLDGAAVARGGLAGMTGYADRTPVLPAATIGDHAGGMQLALGVVTALLARERHGVAQQVQTSALGTQMWLQQWELAHTSITGARLERAGPHHPIIRGPYGVYTTADDGAIMLAQVMAEDAWDAFCVFAGCPELALDPRFGTPGRRLGEGLTDTDSAEVRAILAAAFARQTAADWEAFLRTQPEIIFECVQRWHEVLDDVQAHANRYVETVDVPDHGPTRLVGNLVTLGATPGSVKGGPPRLGEGNAELLGRAGLDAATIAAITAHATAVREAALAALSAAR